MKPDEISKDPAFTVMLLDILGNVLSRADNPGRVGEYVTEEVRELTGARCILLSQCISTVPEIAHRVVSVDPARRREWAESPETKHLYEIVHHLPATQLIRAEESSEIAGYLGQEGFGLSVVIPLHLGDWCIGAMFILGLPDEEHITSVLNLFNNLSTIIALVLRNSFLFECQEQIIQERTAALQDNNEKLAMELTERKRAEEALQASEERFRRLTENARDVIYRMSLPDGLYEYMSPAATKIFGYTPEEFYSSPQLVRQVIHPDYHGYFEEQWSGLLRGDMSPTYEFPIIHKCGEVRWMNQRNILIRDDEGCIIAIEGIVTDITERKQAEEQVCQLNQDLEQRVRDRTAELEAANKELADFSYSVSHDLRAPLRHIDGFLELLHQRMAGPLDAQSQRYLDSIAGSSRRMGTLIDSLLTFSRMRRTVISPVPVDLNDLVREAIRELAPEAAGRTINWRVAGLPVVTCDRAMLHQVLVNLLSNAVKFTQPRTLAEIEIGCRPDEKETIIFIRDNGVGFDMAYADKLFGVFQRLHRADEFEGTGIGLANVRRIIQRHGGRVWAEGKVDCGATFYFALPQTIYDSH